MKRTLDQIKRLSNEELIVILWDSQKLEGVIKSLKEFINANDTLKKSSVVLLNETEGFYVGEPDLLINNLFALIEEICQQNKIKFTEVLAEALSNSQKPVEEGKNIE